MKKYTFFAVLLTLIMSCTKKDNDNSNLKSGSNPDSSSATLSISGIEDIKLQKTAIDSIVLNLNTTFSGSVHDTISLSITGLPQGININPSATLSGVDSFKTRLVFYDTSTTICPLGDTYPITITCNGSISAQKTFKFNLVILPVPPIATNLLGIYNNCTAFEIECADDVPYSYTENISADACTPNEIYFNNYLGLGLSVYANVIIDSLHQQDLIIIPQQTIDSYIVEADTAIYKNGAIHMNYDAVSRNKHAYYSCDYATLSR